jgi:hypothetical protein
MSNEMKMIIAMTFLSLLCFVAAAKAQPADQEVCFNIPGDTVAKALEAVAQCNAETGDSLTPKQWVARHVKAGLRECYIRIQPPNTGEFDQTWPDEVQ